ncbi:MAG: hypothetical protein GYB67_11475, partial [Chloroflexi bacterium]|nr:hypothetical protein [Chloroflexota bacterium]
LDGGRPLGGEESFTLATRPGEDLVLVTRLHPVNVGQFDVYIGDTRIATRVIPQLPGGWLEVPTLIPAEYIDSTQTRVRIVPGAHYQPYHHWAYQGHYTPDRLPETPLTRFQDGAIVLAAADLQLHGDQLAVTLRWATDGSANGDYKIFVHVLDAADRIAAQADSRPGRDALPPGNWLMGSFQDVFALNLSDAPSGRYTVAIGLYDPYDLVTFERLTPAGGDDQRRFIIGEFMIDQSESADNAAGLNADG